jgi:hypothetical protein
MKWAYNEPDKNYNDVLVVKTEQEIIDDFFKVWKEKMEIKYGKIYMNDKTENELKKMCIKDWCVLHWAWKKNE